MVYSAACLAPRTPCASEAARPATASTVLAVARPPESRLARKASTSAVPTTAPSALAAIPRAASGVRMPKPTQTGSLVCRLMRATASPTTPESALALPVIPVIEKAGGVGEHRGQPLVVGGRRREPDEVQASLQRRQAQFGIFLRRQVDDDQAVDAG